MNSVKVFTYFRNLFVLVRRFSFFKWSLDYCLPDVTVENSLHIRRPNWFRSIFAKLAWLVTRRVHSTYLFPLINLLFSLSLCLEKLTFRVSGQSKAHHNQLERPEAPCIVYISVLQVFWTSAELVNQTLGLFLNRIKRTSTNRTIGGNEPIAEIDIRHFLRLLIRFQNSGQLKQITSASLLFHGRILSRFWLSSTSISWKDNSFIDIFAVRK